MAEIAIVLAEYITRHPDDTLTIVRGGIEEWEADVLPKRIALSAAIFVPTRSLNPRSRYDLAFSIATPGGRKVVDLTGIAEVLKSGPSIRAHWLIAFDAEVYGAYRVNAKLGPITGELVLKVRPPHRTIVDEDIALDG